MSTLHPSTAAQTSSGAADRPADQVPPAAQSVPVKRVLVLGLGNDLLTDDAVGLHVVRAVGRRLPAHAQIEVMETGEMGLSLLDYVVGYRDLLLVDAVQTGKAAPGVLHEIDGTDLKVLPAVSPHFLGVGETLALGKTLGLAVPARVRICAIEVADPFTMGSDLSPALQAALPALVGRVVELARELAGSA